VTGPAAENQYAAAGVDTTRSDAGVGALVDVLKTIRLDRSSASVLPSGHYASVLRVAPNLGIALATDGVGSKLVVAEQADRLETVGIDCIAMNVNDVICVGAEPIAMVDYLAVEAADPVALARIAEGLKTGAEQANIEIPGGELAVIPELIRGHGPAGTNSGFDLCGTAFGTVALDRIVTGADIRAGDAVIGVPSSGLHSNGYTLARKALLQDAVGGPALGLDDAPAALNGATVADALLEPTVIYVKAIVELLASDIAVGGLAHITGGGLTNLLRLVGKRLGFRIESPLAAPPVFGLIQERAQVPLHEMWEVFNMGCGFAVVVPEDRCNDAIALIAERHPHTARIGTVTNDGGTISVPSLGIAGDAGGLRPA